MKPALKFFISLLLILVFINVVLLGLYINPSLLFALLAKFSTSPKPGSCLILEEKYCRKGILIKDPSSPDGLLAAFKIPKGTVLFAPVDGFYSHTPTFFFIKDEATKEVVKYPGATISVGENNTSGEVKEIYSFIYFKQKENSYPTGIKRGEIIGWVAEKPIDFLGDYNLVVGITEQKNIEGKIIFEDNNERLKTLLNIK
jgi:hypothetical protein